MTSILTSKATISQSPPLPFSNLSVPRVDIKKPSVNSITSSMVSAVGFSPRLEARLPHSVSPAFLRQTTIITWLGPSLLVTRLYCYKTKTASTTDVVDNATFVLFSSPCKNTLIFCEIQEERMRIFAFTGWNRRPVNPEK